MKLFKHGVVVINQRYNDLVAVNRFTTSIKKTNVPESPRIIQTLQYRCVLIPSFHSAVFLSMNYEAVVLSCIIFITAVWMLLHGIRGAQTGVIVESRKGSPVEDYYYRGDIGFYVNVFFYITGGTAMVGLSTWLLMRGLGYG